MEGVGVVRKIYDDKIIVEFTRQSACGESCATCNAKCAESETEYLEFKNNISAQKGDIVKLKNNKKSILLYKFLVYGLPLLLFMFSVSISYSILEDFSDLNRQILSLSIGVLSMIVAYFIIKFVDNQFKKHNNGIIILEKL